MPHRILHSFLALGLLLGGCSDAELVSVHQKLQDVKISAFNSSATSLMVSASITQAILYHMALGFSDLMARKLDDETALALEPLKDEDTQFYYDFKPEEGTGRILAFREGRNVVNLFFLFEQSRVDMGHGYEVKAIVGDFEGYQFTFPLLTFMFTGLLDETGGAYRDENGDYVFDVRVEGSGFMGVGGQKIHRIETASIALRYPLADKEVKVGEVKLVQQNGSALAVAVSLVAKSLSLRGELLDSEGRKSHDVAMDSAGKVSVHRVEAAPPPAPSSAQPTP